MDQFIYFNPRLTNRLNAIYHYPLTVVSGSSGIGKTFAVQTFLSTNRAEVIWHASRMTDFGHFIREFQKNYALVDESMNALLSDFPGADRESAHLAVEAAVIIKKRALTSRRVYVLDYQGASLPGEILTFLDCLASQQIHGMYIVLICGGGLPREPDLPQARMNRITEETFLLTPVEVRQAFSRNGVQIGSEEANYLYLLSAGWLPTLKAQCERLQQEGKAVFFDMPEVNSPSYRFADPQAGRAWAERFAIDRNTYNAPEFAKIRTMIERLELEAAFIAVEMARMNMERFTQTWDLCDYYAGILMALGGEAKKALEDMNRGFALRVREGLFQSAWRILLGQMQLRMLLGDFWFNDARELLLRFAREYLYGGNGISRRTAGLALWRAGEYRKIIALFTEQNTEDEVDTGYREFLLADAFHALGFEVESAEHLDAGWTAVAEGRATLSALLFYEASAGIDRALKRRSGPRYTVIDPAFREKLAAFRKIQKRNQRDISSGERTALTMRESEVAELVSKKMTNKEIASLLNISENTVKTTLKHIYRKLGIASRRELE